MSAPEPRRRWSAPVAVPADLSCLRGPTSGTVTLPHRLYWSGTGGPRTLDLGHAGDVAVAALVARLGAPHVLELASANDDGFSAAVFARALEVAAARPGEEFHRLGLDEPSSAELRAWARWWAGRI